MFNLSNVDKVVLYLPKPSCSFAYFKLSSKSAGSSKISSKVISANKGCVQKITKRKKIIFL